MQRPLERTKCGNEQPQKGGLLCSLQNSDTGLLLKWSQRKSIHLYAYFSIAEHLEDELDVLKYILLYTVIMYIRISSFGLCSVAIKKEKFLFLLLYRVVS